jgi:hypothetical protein
VNHEECKTVPRQECKTVEKAFTVQEPVQECADRVEEVCVPAPRQKCTTVHDEVPRLVSYRNFLTNHEIKSWYRIYYTHVYRETNHFYQKKFADSHVQFTINLLKFNLLPAILILTFLSYSLLLFYLFSYLFICAEMEFSLVSQVPRQVCKDVAREECAQVPREITTYKTEQECSTHTQKQCKPAQKTVCDETVTTR